MRVPRRGGVRGDLLDARPDPAQPGLDLGRVRHATDGTGPAGVRDLAEAYALLQGTLTPNVGVVHNTS